MAAVRTEDRTASPCGTFLPPEQITELDRMVRAVAGRLRARLPDECGIEMADLVQAGNVGLLQAARTYEPGRGAPLAGYAKFRIRGEMLDMVRRNIGRERVVSSLPGDSDGNSDWESRIPASADSSPQTGIMNRQRSEVIGEEIDRLPAKYRAVVRLRYSREMTLRQIGQVLSVNESRACQIHQRALSRLKRALSNRGVKHLSHL
jgi:RNA polymerase sigma factor for flagellar operon FliA